MTTRITSFVLLAMLLAVSATAQDRQLRPGRLEREERAALEPGLKVEYASLDTEAASDIGDARLAALYVAENDPPTPFLPPGRFRAVFTGYLKLRLRGEYDFAFRGRGAVKLSFNDQQVLEIAGGDLAAVKPVHVELVKGYNKLRIEYTSPPEGDAKMRLYWSSDEFPPEPVFPTILTHDGRDEAWRGGETLRQGRLLVAHGRCLRCHALPEAVQKEIQMPELEAAAPSLAGVGSRLSSKWIGHWIHDPARLRNRTTMPQVLQHNGATNLVDVVEIAAYLHSLKTKDDDATRDTAVQDDSDNDALIETGLQLFEDRGCIACHRFTPPGEIEEEYDRVSLHFAAEKFLPGALAAFIADSRRHYPWSRMPKFDFSREEAAGLAAYVRAQSKGSLDDILVMKAADPARGRELFHERGCAACHATEADEKTAPPRHGPFASLTAGRGCLSAEDEGVGRAPRFPFTVDEREAISVFLKRDLKQDLSSLTRKSPAEFSGRQFDVIGCQACHSRDDTQADLPYILADFGELGHPAEPVPDLTWAGEKLKPAWTEKLFLGQIPYRPRPHFKIRMPEFPARGKLLALGLSAEHGFAPGEDARPQHNPKLAQTGEAVAAMHTGLACHRCHAIGERQATAPFEARSTNLSFANERLRYRFYHRWMRDPLRIDPQTKMIKFAQDGEKTGLTDFYDGDAHAQFEAVWHYLKLLNEREKRKQGEHPSAEADAE